MRRRKLWPAAVLSLALASCGGGGGGDGDAPASGAPTFTSTSSVSVVENTTGAFFSAAATDPDGGALTFSITGGPDAVRLAITPQGAVSFVAPPDFDAPVDADRNNVYQAVLQVSDGSQTATQMLSVTVTGTAGALGLRRVATGFSSPVFLTGTRDGTGRVFVVERGGRIRILDPATGAIAPQAFLDVSSQIATDGERGLLGFAPAPDYATSGRFYVHLINTSGAGEIRRYQRASASAADPASADVILSIPHAGANHLGGWIGFGPDSLLYIGMGDDRQEANAQNTSNLYGKILRIDPRTDGFPADANRDYAIPSGNPFATSGGAPEIWVYGLRNPFRNSFDRETGNLYIGDVGEGAWEEISLARPSDGGRNYGWLILEGTHSYSGGATAGLTPPVLEYGHGTGAFQGNSITGGYVYRGPLTALRGEYFFGDFINQRLWSIPVASLTQGQTATTFTDRKAQWTPNAGVVGMVVSFGEDDAGNLYVVDFDGEIFVIRAG